MSQSHCLTGFRVTREQGHHEPVERMDEWIGDVHLISPASTFWPEGGVISKTALGVRSKLSGNSQASTTLVKDRKKEAFTEHAAPMFIEETSMEMEEQPEMEHMPKQVEGTNLELYGTGENERYLEEVGSVS